MSASKAYRISSLAGLRNLNVFSGTKMRSLARLLSLDAFGSASKMIKSLDAHREDHTFEPTESSEDSEDSHPSSEESDNTAERAEWKAAAMATALAVSGLSGLPVARAEPAEFGILDVLPVAEDVVAIPIGGFRGKNKKDRGGAERGSGGGGGKRPPTTRVAAFKTSRTDKLGIKLGEADGRLVVSAVSNSPGALFGGKGLLRAGDVVVAICGNASAAGWTPDEAAERLGRAVGRVSIVVADAKAAAAPRRRTAARVAVRKSSMSRWLGVAFENDSKGRLRVRTVDPDGPLGRDEVLRAGDVVERINGAPCSKMDHPKAASIVRNIPCNSFVTIDVSPAPSSSHQQRRRRPRSKSEERSARRTSSLPLHLRGGQGDDDALSDTSPVVATEVAESDTENARNPVVEPGIISVSIDVASVEAAAAAGSFAGLGVRLGNDGDGRLFVSKIVPGGILSGTPGIRVGARLLSIDHVECHRWDADRAIRSLREICKARHKKKGAVGLVLLDPRGDVGCVMATAYKSATGEGSVGIKFSKKSGEKMMVGGIKVDGSFASSALVKGYTVLEVNGVPYYERLDPEKASDIVRGVAPGGAVTILARRQKKGGAKGVVVARSSRRRRRPPRQSRIAIGTKRRKLLARTRVNV